MTLVMCAVGFVLGIPYVTKVGPLTRLTTSACLQCFHSDSHLSPCASGRHLRIPADGKLHGGAVPCVPGPL